MKRPLVLLCASMVFILIASSVSAARSPFEYNSRSVLNFIRMNIFLFYGEYFLDAEEDEVLVLELGDYIVGGDADDFGNGRDDNRIIPGNTSRLRITPSGEWDDSRALKGSGNSKIEIGD